MTVPLVGQETLRVAISPTLDANGEYCVTKHTAVYAGLVVPIELEVGLITTVALDPNNGYSVASTDAAPKSCMKFKVNVPCFKPAILVLHSPPNAVVSKSSASSANSTELRLVANEDPLMVIA